MDMFSLQDYVPKEYIDYVQQAAETVQQAAEGSSPNDSAARRRACRGGICASPLRR